MKSVDSCDTALLAEICGIHIGDGYVRSDDEGRNELDISGSREEQSYYDDHVAPLFAELLDVDITPRWFPNRSTYGFRVYGEDVSRFFIDRLGFPNGKKEEIAAPPFVMQADSYEVVARFLRGLYDTDGCLNFYRRHGYGTEFQQTYHYYPRIEFTNTSETLIEQVEELLERLDIGFFRGSYGGSKWRKRYNVTSVGEHRLTNFMERVGFKNAVKFTRYHVWKLYGFCPTNTSLEERYKMICGDEHPREYYMGP